MMKILLAFVLIFLISFVFAKCEEGQIDINSASVEELDKIVYVGVTTAEKIIDERPFDNVDELIDVYGIGDAKLTAIKNQGLACVENEKYSENTNDKEENEKISDEENKTTETLQTETEIEEENKIEKQEIKLSPQNIKTSEGTKNSKKNYAIYGLVLFCLLLAGLFFFKLKKQRYEKNEFR